MSDNDVDRWVVHLRALSDRAEGDPAAVPGAAVIAPLIRATLEGTPAGVPLDASVDVRLWAACSNPSIDPVGIIDPMADGPLFEQGEYLAIEVWTETELCALHALETVAARRDRADLLQRVRTARDWHLENTQPDNATNRPWALHVFLRSGTAEGRLYAETLVHNCMAMAGRPDAFSALILRHAAARLSSRGQSPFTHV